jgi:hypothetical protein
MPAGYAREEEEGRVYLPREICQQRGNEEMTNKNSSTLGIVSAAELLRS